MLRAVGRACVTYLGKLVPLLACHFALRGMLEKETDALAPCTCVCQWNIRFLRHVIRFEVLFLLCMSMFAG